MDGTTCDTWIILPGLVLPEQLADRLADVAVHSGQTRDAVVRLAIAAYVDGYITGSGLAE